MYYSLRVKKRYILCLIPEEGIVGQELRKRLMEYVLFWFGLARAGRAKVRFVALKQNYFILSVNRDYADELIGALALFSPRVVPIAESGTLKKLKMKYERLISSKNNRI